MALAWLRQLCDSSLHLADYEADLASLGPSATGPRLTTRVVREHWESWNDDTCAATLEVELSNATDDPIRIAEVCLSGLWDPPSAERPTLSHAEHAELDGALMLLDWESSEPLLSSHQSVPPHGSVTGWVFASTPRRPGSTPKVELMVREAVGTTYVTGISPTDPNFSRA